MTTDLADEVTRRLAPARTAAEMVADDRDWLDETITSVRAVELYGVFTANIVVAGIVSVYQSPPR